MDTSSTLTASDIALLEGNNGMGNNGFIWILALLFLFMFSGNGWGNNADVATKSTVQDGFNFAALERQNNETIAAIKDAVTTVNTTVKDGNYNLLGEIRDLEQASATGFAEVQKSSTEIMRSIDGVNYNNALNKADITAAIHSEGEATRALIQQNKIDDMQNRINQLELQSQLSGVVRYPYGMTYNAGTSPFCGCSNCGTV